MDLIIYTYKRHYDIINIVVLKFIGGNILDEFIAGVAPGGLTGKSDIKLLICYILSGIDNSLSKEDIISILKDNNLANYFEASDAFSDSISTGLIYVENKEEKLYSVTDEGKMIAKQLDVALPLSIREKALKAALNTLAKAKIRKENVVTIEKNELGYFVNFNVSGGNIDLMSLKLYVPDIMQANMVKENFYNDPEIIYSTMLALLTQDKSLVIDSLKKITNNKT